MQAGLELLLISHRIWKATEHHFNNLTLPFLESIILAKYWLEGLMLKLQYFSHLMQRDSSLEETLMRERLEAAGEGAAEDEAVG